MVQHEEDEDEFELGHEEENALAEVVVHEEMTKEMSRGETSKLGVNGSHDR